MVIHLRRGRKQGWPKVLVILWIFCSEYISRMCGVIVAVALELAGPHYGNWWRRGRCCTATLGRAWKRGSGAPSSGTSTSLISWPRRRSGSYESTRPGMYQLPPSTPLPPRPLWPPPPWPLPWPLHSLLQCVPCSRTLQRLQFLCTSHRTRCLLICSIPLMFLLEVNGPESDVVPIYPHHLQGGQGCAVEVAPTFWLTKLTIFYCDFCEMTYFM